MLRKCGLVLLAATLLFTLNTLVMAQSGSKTSAPPAKVVSGIGVSRLDHDLAVAKNIRNDRNPQDNLMQPQTKHIHLVVDKLGVLDWPPESVNRLGVSHSLGSIFAPVGIEISITKNNSNLSSRSRDSIYTRGEVDAYLDKFKEDPDTAGNAWHIRLLILNKVAAASTGILIDQNNRKLFAVFIDQLANDEMRLRTQAHELGHVLNLGHTDNDSFHQTIMNQSADLDSGWNYTWSDSSMTHFRGHPEERWRPMKGGFAFEKCHPRP